MYVNHSSPQPNSTIQNMKALEVDNAQNIRTAFLSLMARRLQQKRLGVLF